MLFGSPSLNSQKRANPRNQRYKKRYSFRTGTICTQRRIIFGYFDCHTLQLTFKGRDLNAPFVRLSIPGD